MTGIIFDFNGTMFLDSDLHEAAWLHIIQKYTKKELSDEDRQKNIHGKTNPVLLRQFIDKDLTDEEVQQLSDEKEAYYRSLVVESPEHQTLTKGLEETLDLLKEKEIPRTIASASPKVNMDFYFDYFDLAKWFDYSTIVYDDGSFPGKPDPSIFLLAAKKLALLPSDCLVLEDSYSGLQAANAAQIGTIVGIDPFGTNEALFQSENLAKDGIIKDFTTFPALYLNN